MSTSRDMRRNEEGGLKELLDAAWAIGGEILQQQSQELGADNSMHGIFQQRYALHGSNADLKLVTRISAIRSLVVGQVVMSLGLLVKTAQ